jgi:beta-galactosidase
MLSQASKNLVVLIAIWLMSSLMGNAGEQPVPRERVLFNAGWKFQKKDPDGVTHQLGYGQIKDQLIREAARGMDGFISRPEPAQNPFGSDVAYVQGDFDDSGWRKVTLPHDWGIEGPFKQEYPGDTGKLAWWGVGWYRKHFELPSTDAGRRIYLDVEGAMSYATVWCNGQFAGGWPYGYASWRVDLTPFVKPGKTNSVAIRLDNPPDSSRWYPGGGIYRNVWLVKASPVHVANWGTKITTPEASSTTAKVNIETRVANTSGVQAAIEVQTQLYELAVKNDTERRKLAATSEMSAVIAPPNAAATVSQEVTVGRPKLWNLDAPNIYVAVTRLTQAGKVVDEYETTFGIRSIEFTADRGFLLNGKRVQFQGVCNHHDLGALGAAFNRRAAETRSARRIIPPRPSCSIFVTAWESL